MDNFVIKDKAIEIIKGKAILKPSDDQNTDDIIPARYMKEVTFEKMGDFVYIDERYKEGKLVEDHPFNKKGATESNILIVGANYGCGSSREHAPQALYRFGIRAIIAESFAEIFSGNCNSLGIVCVVLSKENIDSLLKYLEKNPLEEISVDLNEKTISFGNNSIDLEIPEARRRPLLNGTWDALAVLQQDEEGIKDVENRLEYLKIK